MIFALSLATSSAFADSVFVGSLERKDVKIVAFRNGVVEFTIAGRSVAPVEAARITRLALDDEPGFTQADKAFSDGAYAQAADGYRNALAATKRPWLADWVAPRLLQSANRAGKLDAAVSAFNTLLLTDINAAVAHRPVVAGSSAELLRKAVVELARAGSQANLSATQQLAAKGLLLDVYLAQEDGEAAGRMAGELARFLDDDSNDPAMQRSLARLRLSMARLSLSKADHAGAMAQLRANSASFTEPVDQAEAFFLLAQAQDGAAGQTPSADVLRDIAIAYMRSVAASQKAADRRFMPAALFRVAEIEQQLGEVKAAASLYGEVAAEYKDSPLAARAARQHEILSKQTGP